jgi:hypothetical protein
VSTLVVTGAFALVCIVAFFVGLRFYRMADPPSGTSPEQVQRFGRLMMMVGVGMLLFLIAVIVHGDLNVIKAAKAIR